MSFLASSLDKEEVSSVTAIDILLTKSLADLETLRMSLRFVMSFILNFTGLPSYSPVMVSSFTMSFLAAFLAAFSFFFLAALNLLVNSFNSFIDMPALFNFLTIYLNSSSDILPFSMSAIFFIN